MASIPVASIPQPEGNRWEGNSYTFNTAAPLTIAGYANYVANLPKIKLEPLYKDIDIMLFIRDLECPNCSGEIFYSIRIKEFQLYNRWNKLLTLSEGQNINTVNHKGIKRLLKYLYSTRKSFNIQQKRYESGVWVVRCNGCDLQPSVSRFDINDIQYHIHMKRIDHSYIVSVRTDITDPNKRETTSATPTRGVYRGHNGVTSFTSTIGPEVTIDQLFTELETETGARIE